MQVRRLEKTLLKIIWAIRQLLFRAILIWNVVPHLAVICGASSCQLTNRLRRNVKDASGIGSNDDERRSAAGRCLLFSRAHFLTPHVN